MTAAAQITTHTHTERPRIERIAPERQLILRVIDQLAPARIGIENETAETIELSVEREGWMLVRITFGRQALRRLFCDSTREVKLEYLVRDIVRSAPRRARWSYGVPR